MLIRTLLRFVFATVMLVGCPKSRAPEDAGAPVVAASVSVSVATPSASVKSAPPSKESTDIANAVRAWNEATNAHDSKKLGTLYADQVELYGREVSRAKAVAIKEAAFAKHDRDDLTDITIMKTRALFTKKSKSKDGKIIQVTGYLDVDPSSTKITAEGDTTTDTNLARKKMDDCASAVGALVSSTKSPDTWTRQIGSNGDGTWTVQFTMEHLGDPNGNYSYVIYTVETATGTVKDFGGGVLAGDPAIAAKVRELCK